MFLTEAAVLGPVFLAFLCSSKGTVDGTTGAEKSNPHLQKHDTQREPPIAAGTCPLHTGHTCTVKIQQP